MDVVKQLESLQRRIAQRNDLDQSPYFWEHLAIIQTGTSIHCDFYGSRFSDSYCDLLDTLAHIDVAPRIRSLVFRNPDEGTNGTIEWDLSPLVSTSAEFSQLGHFAIQLNQPSDHNRSIIGTQFDENGVLAKLITKSPNIQELIVPSAPNAEFFNIGERPIRYLNVDAGYDPQNFISNLAESACFPAA